MKFIYFQYLHNDMLPPQVSNSQEFSHRPPPQQSVPIQQLFLNTVYSAGDKS